MLRRVVFREGGQVPGWPLTRAIPCGCCCWCCCEEYVPYIVVLEGGRGAVRER